MIYLYHSTFTSYTASYLYHPGLERALDDADSQAARKQNIPKPTMSDSQIAEIEAPDPSTIKQASSAAVAYNERAGVVTGLNNLLDTKKGVIACASDGRQLYWFRCRSSDDAVPLMKQYHLGHYTQVTWYTEN